MEWKEDVLGNVLEVKYDELLPDYITNVLRTVPLKRTSFSKYYYTRKNQMIKFFDMVIV